MDSTQSIINAVMSGLGISIVSELAARQMLKQKILLPIKLKNELPERKIYAVINKNIVHSHLTKLFMEYTIKGGLNFAKLIDKQKLQKDAIFL